MGQSLVMETAFVLIKLCTFWSYVRNHEWIDKLPRILRKFMRLLNFSNSLPTRCKLCRLAGCLTPSLTCSILDRFGRISDAAHVFITLKWGEICHFTGTS